MTTNTAKSMLLKFRQTDTVAGISHDTMKRLAEHFGFNETQAVHYALAKLAREVLPSYETDDGPLTKKQLNSIRKQVPQGTKSSVASSLF